MRLTWSRRLGRRLEPNVTGVLPISDLGLTFSFEELRDVILTWAQTARETRDRSGA